MKTKARWTVAACAALSAAAEQRTCADLQTFLRELNRREQQKNPTWSFMRPGTWKFDRVHPTAFGHQFFAYVFLKAQGAPAEVATISVEAARGLTNETRNAVITDFVSSPSSLSFTALEKALPYPFDADGLKACAYAPIVDELDRETFRATGLEPGLYELSIDGAAVGRWTSADLAVGVNLATNALYAEVRRLAKPVPHAWRLVRVGCDLK